MFFAPISLIYFPHDKKSMLLII